MSMENPPTDSDSVFNKLKEKLYNMLCFDCNATYNGYASVTFGIFLCNNCADEHGSLGVSASLIKKVYDTRWEPEQLKKMMFGGNNRALAFFKHHGLDCGGEIRAKYTSRAAELYKQILEKEVALSTKVTEALRDAALESSNLILGIDFTESNECAGNVSFNNQSLHAIGDTPNPYENAISVIGKTLAPFNDNNLIPCFGFGDATTHDAEVFSFHSDHSPCHGFEEVLECYRKIVQNVQLAGPTSYGPVVDAAIDIVEKSGGQSYVLVIIADGQVTRSLNTGAGELSPQEEKTIQSIVNASLYPLLIILVGVGDGPWEYKENFDEKVPACKFNNFQFVHFTGIMSEDKETDFARADLMKIRRPYEPATELDLVRRMTGNAGRIVPRPPPVPCSSAPPERQVINTSSSALDDRTQLCPICLTNETRDLAFNCGHVTCRDCGSKVSNCPICHQRITKRLRLFL